jgi:hypothetical protein
MLLLLAVGLGSPAQAGLLGDVLDPIVGEEGEEGEGGLIEDILDPVLGEEGEGEDGLVNEILDPILGEEGEDDGGLIDDILEPILDGDGELLDELLEPILDGEILDELLGVLPIPILGPDAYEPDNSPLAAVWSGLRDITGLTALDILTRLQTHNFHVEGDEDWKRFYALSGQTVSVETLDLLSKSDTFISVYRQLDEGEVVSFRPTECLEDAIAGPNGVTLVPVACNDDVSSGVDLRRSRAQFVAPRTGFYYVKVQYSPKPRANKDGETSGPETTYNYTAMSSGIFASSLFCTVQGSDDDEAITNGMVELNPHGIQQTYNNAGVYPLDGIPSGTYTLRVTAPGRTPHQQIVQVYAGQVQEVFVSMSPVGGSGNEGETEGGSPAEGEGPAEGEQPGEGEAAQAHSADFEAPHGVLSLSEVLRGTQLYNARSYHCDATTEDGYAPFNGPRIDCTPHAGDYVDSNWSLSLSELLRLVQLFNLGTFSPCGETEDGYCANP